MLKFQLIVVPLLLLAALAEVRRLATSNANRRFHWFRLFVWLLAAASIAFPQLTEYVALSLGITRGADLVNYVFILFALGALFRLYSNQFVIEKKIAELSRQVAIRDAQFPADDESATGPNL